jgi:CheY-like chemotaxis protein
MILIVDDDPNVRLLLAEILDVAGEDFLTAAGGEEALLLLEDAEPDLLLLDVTMPGTDGWQVIREVRANPKLRDLPIIVLSDHVSIPNVMSYGAQANVCKPVDGLAMLDTLGEVLCLGTV